MVFLSIPKIRHLVHSLPYNYNVHGYTRGQIICHYFVGKSTMMYVILCLIFFRYSSKTLNVYGHYFCRHHFDVDISRILFKCQPVQLHVFYRSIKHRIFHDTSQRLSFFPFPLKHFGEILDFFCRISTKLSSPYSIVEAT